MLEVYWAFLKLGCTAFGGPVAHLGYFQAEFVDRRQWLSEEAYADLVALCQFLPGPASSQVGLALGYRRAGGWGALAAWLGFTLPSAALMAGFAFGMEAVAGLGRAGWVQGLKVAAVAVVAQAVITMARKLCPDVLRALIAAFTAGLLLWFAAPLAPLGAMAAGALCYYVVGPTAPTPPPGAAGRTPSLPGAAACLAAYAGLLVLLPLGVHFWPAPRLALGSGLYRSGALVFGGGHVVLPLLERAVVAPGWVAEGTFLAGYGAAQALPGPLFAFSAFLGAEVPPGGLGNAATALVALYLPGVLVLFAALPYWERLRASVAARRLLAGANAAVVGLLAAALISPIGTAAVASVRSLGLVLLAFAGLQFARLPSWLIVLGCAAAGFLLR